MVRHDDKIDAQDGTPPPSAHKFMESTWHLDASKRGFKGFFKNPFYSMAYPLIYKGPYILRKEKMPVLSWRTQQQFVVPRWAAPMILQYISMKYFDYSWPAPLAFLVYWLSFVGFAMNMLAWENWLTEKVGFLDGEYERDGIPDIVFTKTILGLFATVTLRPLLSIFTTYDRDVSPLSVFTWRLPIDVIMYNITLDFWFYWYHRAMHEIDFLWKYHKTHHMTKHPSAALSAFGDEEQDAFDIVGIPLITWLTYPLDFHTWWIASVYTIFVEAAGHTGARIYWISPTNGRLLRLFGMELVLEDHDLHHRRGWKKSFNYGKQTRVWDVVFGTAKDRIEMIPENVDFSVQL